MPARLSIGISGGFPADMTDEETIQQIRDFASLGFIHKFYEVVGEDLYQFSYDEGETAVLRVDPAEPLADWNPNEWIGDYTYQTWYVAVRSAWKSRPGGDVTYDEWSRINYAVFVPFYEGETRWVKVGPGDDKHGVCSVETGIAIARELELPSYVFRTLDVANEFLFLARIS